MHKGQRVNTPLGTGTVEYIRMSPPDYRNIQAVSVKLDSAKDRPGYVGTLFPPKDVKEMEPNNNAG